MGVILTRMRGMWRMEESIGVAEVVTEQTTGIRTKDHMAADTGGTIEAQAGAEDAGILSRRLTDVIIMERLRTRREIMDTRVESNGGMG